MFNHIWLRFCLLVAIGSLSFAQGQWKDYPVHPASLDSVRVEDEFWGPRLETNRNVTFWHVVKQAEETGEFDNFAKAGVAWFQITGKRSLLDVAIRSANLIHEVFGPAPNQRHDTSGHEEIELALEKGYAALRRTWNSGDTIELNLPMPIHRVLANEGIEADRGRIALERGPLVYCAEGIDNGGSARNLILPAGAELAAEHRKDLLGGGTADSSEPIVAIPFYAWANRDQGEMCMWLPAKIE